MIPDTLSQSSAHHDNSTDEIFANSSTETVIENIDFSLILKEGFEFTCSQPEVKSSAFGSHVSNPNGTKQNVMAQSLQNNLIPIGSGEIVTDISAVARELVNEAVNIPQKLFCPFCIYHFCSEYLLKDHVKSIHEHELNKLLNEPYADKFTFNPCPFCHGKFYLKSLVCKHVMNYHHNDVLNIFQCTDPDAYTTCIFCSHKVLKKHEKLLLMHIEKKHSNELQNFIEHKLSEAVDISCHYFQTSEPEISDILSQISNKIASSNLKTSTNYHNSPRSILKNRDMKYAGSNQKNNIQDRYNSPVKKTSIPVRRGLKFGNAESGSQINEKENKSNICYNARNVEKHGINKVEVRKRKRQTWKSIFSFKKNNVPDIPVITNVIESKGCKVDLPSQVPSNNVMKPKFTCSTPISVNCHDRKEENNFSCDISPCKMNSSVKRVMFKGVLDEGIEPLVDKMDVDYSDEVSAVKQFQCALCEEAYVDNGDLVRHIKKFHRGPKNLFHPQYRCGECEAKFYKNSYLVRHCQFHHTPLCLRNKNKLC